MGVSEDRIAALEHERDVVVKQIQANRNQARTTLNDSDRVRLEEELNQLKARYETLTTEIERLRTGGLPELTPAVVNRFKAELYNEWEAELHWLNYDKQENRLHTLVRVKKQEAVLLLIQHRRKMKADLYIKRIRRRVLDNGRLHPVTENLSKEGRIDPRRFIECLQDRLRIHPVSAEFGAAVQGVIQTLQQAVTHGQTLYLEIGVEQLSEGFLGWFREQFWRPLVEALLRPRQGSGVIVILTTEDALPKGHIQREWCCQVARFDCYKYCEIKLLNWQQTDIERWMSQYLNASLHKRSLPPQQAPDLAKKVYANSKGVPVSAHNFILVEILTQVVDQLAGQCHATS